MTVVTTLEFGMMRPPVYWVVTRCIHTMIAIPITIMAMTAKSSIVSPTSPKSIAASLSRRHLWAKSQSTSAFISASEITSTGWGGIAVPGLIACGSRIHFVRPSAFTSRVG